MSFGAHDLEKPYDLDHMSFWLHVKGKYYINWWAKQVNNYEKGSDHTKQIY